LWDAVSFTKGCYIGQEIIARMESRGKLARRLSGIVLDAPVTVGAEVRAGESVVGTVTSAGVLPGLGPVALSVLKSGACEPDTTVRVGEVTGKVVALPFVN
jgi:aminomethyltransferase